MKAFEGSANPNGVNQPSSSKSDPEASYRKDTTNLVGKAELLTPDTRYNDHFENEERGNASLATEQKKVLSRENAKVSNSAFGRYKY